MGHSRPSAGPPQSECSPSGGHISQREGSQIEAEKHVCITTDMTDIDAYKRTSYDDKWVGAIASLPTVADI